MRQGRTVSETVIRRLPKYYRYLKELMEQGVERISSQELSRLTGFTASQIRQDLNNFGGFGQQGYGYNVEGLKKELATILGVETIFPTVLVGVGHLGQAIARYEGFVHSGFDILALFDEDEAKVGTTIAGHPVHHVSSLEEFVREQHIAVGIITAPKAVAQPIADALIRGGVTGIWNFAATDIAAPEEVKVESVRLNDSLLTLSYYLVQPKDEDNDFT